jgi:hypothetical protein
VDGLADTVVDVLSKPTRWAPLRSRARALAIERYDLKRVCLPQQLRLLNSLARGELPS